MKDKMVTRTVTVKKVSALAIDTTDNNKVFTFTLDVTGTFKNNDELLKYVKDIVGDNGLIIAQIASVEEEEKLYGMPESVFMAHAKELPPRTKTE